MESLGAARGTSGARRVIAGWLAGPSTFYVAVGLYFLAQAIIVSLVRTGTSFDGAEQLLYTQYAALGYGRSQPPLYTWILIGSQSIFGVSQFAENIVKFGLLGVSVIATFRLLLAFGIGRLPAIAGASMLFLVPEIAWEAQRNYAHTVIMLAAIPLAMLVYLRVSESRSVAGHALLGLLIAVLFLSKYNAVLWVAALLCADLAVRGRAGIVLGRRFILTALVALALVLPHIVWMTQHWGDVMRLSGRFAIGAEPNRMLGRLEGLWEHALAIVLIAGAPTLLAIVATRRLPSVRALLRGPVAVPFVALLILLATDTVLMLVSGATNFKVRWAAPLVFLVVPVLAWHLDRFSPDARKRHIIALAWAAALVAIPGLAFNAKYRDLPMQYHYRQFADELIGRTGADTLLTANYQVFANLRLYRPGLTVLQDIVPDSARLVGTRVVAVWSNPRDLERIRNFAKALKLTLCQDGAQVLRLEGRRPRDRLMVHYGLAVPGACPAPADASAGEPSD